MGQLKFFDVEPCGHESPYKRIDLNPKHEAPPASKTPAYNESQLKEADRIWKLIRHAAGDPPPNDPAPAPAPAQAPDFSDIPEICDIYF
jgi:hypothetical protein